MLCYIDPNRDVKIHDVAVKKRKQILSRDNFKVVMFECFFLTIE